MPWALYGRVSRCTTQSFPARLQGRPALHRLRAKDRSDGESRRQTLSTKPSAQPTGSSADKIPHQRPIHQSAFGPIRLLFPRGGQALPATRARQSMLFVSSKIVTGPCPYGRVSVLFAVEGRCLKQKLQNIGQLQIPLKPVEGNRTLVRFITRPQTTSNNIDLLCRSVMHRRL
jgi:hypothetical protein